MIDEQTLLARVQEKDIDAFEMLYERLKGNVFSLAYQILKSREDAEEVLQDTFNRVFTKAESFRPTRGSVRAFIYTIARNECISRIRKKEVRPQSSGIDIEALSGESQNASQGVSVEQHQTRLYVESALKVLSEEERHLIQKAFFYGYSHSDIAKLTELPLGTVKSKLRQALSRMKHYLEQETERSKHDEHQSPHS